MVYLVRGTSGRAVDSKTRQRAWELFIEVTTRVSTQPLGPEDGFAREALNSLYQLFTRTRELLVSGQPTSRAISDNTVEGLALAMLNRELRPFLAQWHPRLAHFEQQSAGAPDERTWEDNTAFRTQLEQLRQGLINYALGFAQLAGVKDARKLIEAQPPTSPE